MRAEYNDGVGKVVEQKIKVIHKTYSVLTQTDKAIYKPGDNVHFRVLVLDSEMRPYQYEKLNILITDGEKNAISSKVQEFPESGFIEDSMKLADELNFGKWGIHVKVDGGPVNSQNFEVKDYKLPQFKVFLEVESDILLAKGFIEGNVFAKYAFASEAKFVKGTATLTAKVYDPKNMDNPIKTKLRKLDDPQKKNFNFSFNELQIDGRRDKTVVKMETVFKDSLTRKQIVASEFVTVHKHRNYTIEITSDKKVITPGLKFKIMIKVKDFDGSMMDINEQGTVFVTKKYWKNKCGQDADNNSLYGTTMLKDLNKNLTLNTGIASYEVVIPGDANAILFGFRYNGSFGRRTFHRINTKSEENLDLNLLTDK